MPHIIIKMHPGRTGDQKKQLAEAIVRDVAEIAKCEERVVSVSIQEVDPKDWAETVYKPDIMDNPDSLIVKPGYNPFE
jgi:4-oxalocrotonate tautomerase